MADVAEYHADCSMMKGLVLTQDSLTKREALVQAARAAAQKAADNSASGQTVAAVVDAITQADSDQTTTANASATTTTSLATTDLDADRSTLVTCLTEAQTAMTNSAAVTVAKLPAQQADFVAAVPTVGGMSAVKGGKCSDQANWSTQLNKFIAPALAKAGLDTIQQTADDNARRTQLAAAFTTLQTAVLKQADDRIGQIEATRNTAFIYIDGLGKSGATADEVKGALTLLAQPTIVQGDPVFAAMIAGASITGSGATDPVLTSGQLASALAEAQARSFESSAGSTSS